MPDEMTKLDLWRNKGYTIVLSGAPHVRTGVAWACSIVLDDPNDTATGGNDDVALAIQAALQNASKKWPHEGI